MGLEWIGRRGVNGLMARALSMARPGGRGHATGRGNEREETSHGDTDGFHFVEQVGRENRVGVVKCHGDGRRDAASSLGGEPEGCCWRMGRNGWKFMRPWLVRV